MKRWTIWISMGCLLLFSPLWAMAEELITIVFKDGRTQTVKADEIQRIEFQSSGKPQPPSPPQHHFTPAPSQGHRSLIEGLWKTTEGDVRLWLSSSQVTGSYSPGDHGELVGQLRGNIVQGYWIEDSSNRRCSVPKNGRYYWGRFYFNFDGDKFTGKWGYCNDEPQREWNGTRYSN